MIFLAGFLHKIPEGFTFASVMLASGQSKRIAWGASVLLGGATLAGVLSMAAMREHINSNRDLLVLYLSQKNPTRTRSLV